MFHEIALATDFQNRDDDYKKIVAADYLHLLRQIADGKLKTSVPEFANARRVSLKNTLGFETADLLVTMMWNTDQMDVDLHVLEPSGEECNYQNRNTRIGGKITRDITTGFGSEMYYLPEAITGKYEVSVNLFGNNQSRASLRNAVHLTINKRFGKPNEEVIRKTILLETVSGKETVATIGIDP